MSATAATVPPTQPVLRRVGEAMAVQEWVHTLRTLMHGRVLHVHQLCGAKHAPLPL